ncbi:MAG: ABC transporter ATP-binding protein [Gammaproteobacteria bacterium]
MNGSPAAGDGLPLLACRGVHKSFGIRPALIGADLVLRRGEAVALVGLNGAGKSTLLRIALDLLAPDAGEVRISGRPAREPGARADVAYLPERCLPPRHLTGAELIALLLDQHGVDFDAAAATRECIALDLDPAVLARRARDYSKGMAQKLALVACLLADRALLVLDEPMSGLDPSAHRAARTRLAAARAAGTTLLMSSHALHDVAALCERVVVLHAGRIVFDDTFAAFAARAPGADPEAAFLATIAGSSR